MANEGVQQMAADEAGAGAGVKPRVCLCGCGVALAENRLKPWAPGHRPKCVTCGTTLPRHYYWKKASRCEVHYAEFKANKGQAPAQRAAANPIVQKLRSLPTHERGHYRPGDEHYYQVRTADIGIPQGGFNSAGWHSVAHDVLIDVPLSKIKTCQEYVSRGRVEKYLRENQAARDYRPYFAFDGETFWLQDGNHRTSAAFLKGQATIRGIVTIYNRREEAYKC